MITAFLFERSTEFGLQVSSATALHHSYPTFQLSMATGKYAFLRTNTALAIFGLLLGLIGGFRIANYQYRREQGLALQQSVAQAASGAGSTQSTNSSSSQNLTPEQRNQMINEVRALIDKAKNNPQDVEAQLDAAAQFIQISRPEEALQFLEQARKTKPDDARTLAGLGVAYSMMGRFDEAINASKQARTLDPQNPRLTLLLAGAYIQSQQNLAEAEQLLKEIEPMMDPRVIASARADLQAARTGKTESSGNKSVLNHGPEDPKTVKP
jgi:Flp pilus assembly protein TadD